MNVATIVVVFLAGGLIAWALRMIWNIRRGRIEGCASCRLYDRPLTHPPNDLICKTCGGFKVNRRQGSEGWTVGESEKPGPSNQP